MLGYKKDLPILHNKCIARVRCMCLGHTLDKECTGHISLLATLHYTGIRQGNYISHGRDDNLHDKLLMDREGEHGNA